ncbi:hypothetical protein [Sphingopyxis sp. YF1]|uniref:hypothetical protein n=1 Tax=Sphingopyxis sp. YF1 TaxID=2482763 RepID=UPI001F60609E|nr:hypothetical protein [Sphingopyxis sp. YF1]
MKEWIPDQVRDDEGREATDCGRFSNVGDTSTGIETFPTGRLGMLVGIASLRFSVLAAKPLTKLDDIFFAYAHPPTDGASLNVRMSFPRRYHLSILPRQTG